MTDQPKSRANTQPPWRRFGRPHPQITNPAWFRSGRRQPPEPYVPPANDPLVDRFGAPHYEPPGQDGMRR